MTDEEKYSPHLAWVDRKLTARTIEAWNEEARSRAKDDIFMRLTGRTFLGIERDPNAAFVVSVMQKHFLNLATREQGVVVHMVPAIRENSPVAVGIITLNENELSREGQASLEILRSVCDDVSQIREPGEEGSGKHRLRFTVHEVWQTYERRGNRYAEWLRMTYGE